MKFKESINIILLALLVSLFLFTPFGDFKKIVIIGGLMSLWLISSISLNRKSMKDTVPLFVVLSGIMLLQFIYSSFPNNGDTFRLFFTQYLLTFMWGILGVFYASNIDLFKKSIPFLVIMISISCIYTIMGNLAIPNASRLLAGSEKEGDQTYILLHAMNVGGYDFIYALVFALFPAVLWFKFRFSKTILSIAFVLLIIGTLLVGSYFTSILLATIVVIFSLSDTKKLSRFIVISGLLLFIIIIFKDFLLRGLVDFGVTIDSHMLQMRAQEMLDGSYQEDSDAIGQYSRWDRMLNALHNFSQSPIFGRMTMRTLDIKPSGHSEMLSYFERYGICGSIYFYYSYLIYKKIQKNTTTIEMRRGIGFLFIIFLVFIFLNTFDVANATGCMIFLIAPCTMLYIEKRKQSAEGFKHKTSVA